MKCPTKLARPATICGLALIFAARSSQAVDCGKRATGTEQAICTVAGLRAADERMNVVYEVLRKSLPPAQFAALRADQRQWLVDRDAECAKSQREPSGVEACLARVYRRRNEDLGWLAACNGARNAQQANCRVRGEWRVVAVMTASSGVQAVATDDPTYMDAVLVANDQEIRFLKETCGAPSFSPQLASASRWFDENFSDNPAHFGWGNGAVLRLRILRLSCTRGSIGPVAAGPPEFLLRSDSDLGLPFYDGSLLILRAKS